MEVDYIIIHSGERYDFLLETKTRSEIDNLNREDFMIRAETLEVEPNFAEAILHYDNGSNAEPNSTQYKSIKNSSIPVSTRCTETSHCSVLNCPFKDYPSNNLTCIHIHNLKLMFPDLISDNNLPDVEVGEDDKLFFNFGFEGPKDHANSMNARNMKLLPSCPFSLSVGKTEKSNKTRTKIQNAKCKKLNNPETCDNNYINNPEKCICPHVRDTEKGHSIQMVLSTVLPNNETNNTNDSNSLKTDRLKRVNFAHPIHLHGHYIHVVDIQFGTYNATGHLVSTNKDIDCGGTNNCTNPKWKSDKDYAHEKTGKINRKAPLKDTLLIPSGGYAVVYFKANNPGYWFLHCHIELHVLNGMSAVIAEEVSRATSPPEEMLKCGSFPDYTVEQFKIDREADGNDGNNNNNEGDDGNNNNNEGDDGNNNNNEGDDGNNNNNEGDDGNNNDDGEGHDDGGNVVKFEIILITLLCIGVLWSTN